MRQGVEPAVDTLDLLTVLVSLGRAATGGLESIQQLGVGRIRIRHRRQTFPLAARLCQLVEQVLAVQRFHPLAQGALRSAHSRELSGELQSRRVRLRGPIHCRVHGRGRGRESRVLVGRGLDSRRLVQRAPFGFHLAQLSRGVLVGGGRRKRFDFRERRGQLLLVSFERLASCRLRLFQCLQHGACSSVDRLVLGARGEPVEDLAIDRHLHSALERADACFFVLCLGCDVEELGTVLNALGGERRHARVGRLPRDRAQGLHVRDAADRLEANRVERRGAHHGRDVLLIAQCAERLPRDVLAVSGRERRQPFRDFVAQRFVGIRQRDRGEHPDVLYPRRGGPAYPHVGILARQPDQHRGLLRIRAELVDRCEPHVRIR